MTVRRLLALLVNLPAEGAFMSYSVGNGLPWTIETELSAVSIEQTDMLIRTIASAYGAKNLGDPVHITRPWDKKREEVEAKPKLATVSEIKAFMKRGQVRSRKGR